MLHFVPCACATAISVSLLGPVLASQGTKMDPNAKTMTIEGLVRDLACPVQNPAGMDERLLHPRQDLVDDPADVALAGEAGKDDCELVASES